MLSYIDRMVPYAIALTLISHEFPERVVNPGIFAFDIILQERIS